MPEWLKALSAVEKKRLAWLDEKIAKFTAERRRLRVNANQRLMRAKRKDRADQVTGEEKE